MWNDVELPPGEREARIEQFAREQMQAYDGTVFLCTGSLDKDCGLFFQKAAQSLGYEVWNGKALFQTLPAEELANRPGKHVLFVHWVMQEYLGAYLDALPPGKRHVLLYSRRFGNGPSPHMSFFMDFWQERGVDILDLQRN